MQHQPNEVYLVQRMTGAEPGEGQSRLGDRSGQWGNSRGIMDISHAIWMGDLNYRLQAPDKEVGNQCHGFKSMLALQT